MADMYGANLSLEEEILRFLSKAHPDRAALRQDPYPFYDRLRSCSPIVKSPLGPWLASSYKAVNELVLNGRFTRESNVREEDLSLAERIFLRSLVFRDPPAHTRLRRIVMPIFTVSAVEQRRARTRKIAKEILDGLRRCEAFDFRNDFACELPVRIICELIGMPLDDREMFDSWLETLRSLQERSHEPEGEGDAGRDSSIAVPARAAVLERANKVAEGCLAYFERFIDEKRSAPADDITSMLIALSDADDSPLSNEEMLAMLVILHLGGHATTTDVIATGQHTLFLHPESMAALRANSELVPGAVEEMLRYDPPVTVGIPRIAPEDIALAGMVIPRGDHVYPMLAAANRDPEVFPDSHRFDITRRSESRHMAFTLGAHFCVGAPLGRQEAQEAFSLLASEYPPLAPAVPLEDLHWADSLPHRGLLSLPVRWEG
ncbi:MAG: cytochrome P450 [Hyphomonadaceae bacterium]|nr:cytochrome P450 [Hyphomonadaceae bacterium]